LTKTQQISQVRRARRLARYEQVVQLHGQGVKGRDIARRLKMNRGTVRRFLRVGTFPERAKARRPRTLDPYVDYLRQRWAEGCGRATQLLAELKDRGADCSYDMVRRYVASWRTGRRRSEGAPGVPAAGPVPHYPCPSSRRLAWMLLESETELKPEEQSFLKELFSVCQSLKEAAELAQEFHALVSGRQADRLEAWMVKVASRADLPDLGSFVQGLQQDEAAVRAALTLAWSNGQMEGQVNRLKMLKRQMYGRAGFDLLRRRFLLTG
jgi:transposase